MGMRFRRRKWELKSESSGDVLIVSSGAERNECVTVCG